VRATSVDRVIAGCGRATADQSFAARPAVSGDGAFSAHPSSRSTAISRRAAAGCSAEYGVRRLFARFPAGPRRAAEPAGEIAQKGV